jgi:VPDSG-CTERM motif
LGAMLAAGISHNANATLSFTLHDEFSGGQQPVGSVQVDFTSALGGGVDLTITASDFDDLEFLDALYLNLNPLLDPTQLDFGSPTGGSGFGDDPVISLGTDAFKADGDGLYDILLQFDIAPPGDRFDDSDSITYHITGIAGLVEGDFNFLSTPSGGHGPFKAAAHIQGVGPEGEGSGFIAPNGVPDGGATAMLLGTALACLGAFRRRHS